MTNARALCYTQIEKAIVAFSLIRHCKNLGAIAQAGLGEKGQYMTLCEELYFEITLTGKKSDLKKFLSFLKSGELDEFFEFSTDYINYDDEYEAASPDKEVSVVLSNEDYGIEIDEFDTDEFLDVFCRAAKALDVSGTLYDINDEEYNFKSDAGNSYYIDKSKIAFFNEDEDKEVEKEDEED